MLAVNIAALLYLIWISAPNYHALYIASLHTTAPIFYVCGKGRIQHKNAKNVNK